MAVERVYPTTSPLTAGGRVLPTPAAFYVTGEDRLRVTSVNARVGVVVEVHGRIATPRGETIPQAWTHTPASDRTRVTTEQELGVGALLNITVFASGGDPLVGQTFVIVQLIRGAGAAAIILGTLLQGYVTGTQAMGWPGSPIESSIAGGGVVRAILGTAPAAGAEIGETVPTGARWELVALFAYLTTSAAPGARLPFLNLVTPAAVVFGLEPLAAPIPAGVLAYCAWAEGNVFSAFGNNVLTSPLPANQTLLAGSTMSTATTGLQAGDQWSAPSLVVREWLEVP